MMTTSISACSEYRIMRMRSRSRHLRKTSLPVQKKFNSTNLKTPKNRKVLPSPSYLLVVLAQIGSDQTLTKK